MDTDCEALEAQIVVIAEIPPDVRILLPSLKQLQSTKFCAGCPANRGVKVSRVLRKPPPPPCLSPPWSFSFRPPSAAFVSALDLSSMEKAAAVVYNYKLRRAIKISLFWARRGHCCLSHTPTPPSFFASSDISSV